MKMLRLLALVMAVMMLVLAFASCKKNEEEPEETPAPTEPATFANIANLSESKLANVVTAMTELTELDGFSVHTDSYNGGEFILFYKTAENEGNITATYKVVSTRTAKVIATFIESESYDYEITLNSSTPTFVVKSVQTITETVSESVTNTRYNTVYTMYDATGATITSKVGAKVDEAYELYEWVVVNRTVYSVDKATGKLTSTAVIPRNVEIKNNSSMHFDGTRFYSKTSNGVAVYDKDFNYIAEWFKPVKTASYNFFSLNDGNVIIQYTKTLAPDAIEYDMYTGDSTTEMKKYNVVTELFNITDKTSKTLDIKDTMFAGIFSNATVKYNKSRDNIKDVETLVGDFENYAITYPIQEKRINENANVMDIVLFGNDGTIIKTVKLVENQTGIPQKYTDTLYKVATTYGYAITEANGTIVKQVTGSDSVTRVGNYLVDNDGIYNLNYESVYNFDAKNAVKLAVMDNTIFVKQYVSADKYGDYTVYAYSTAGEGDPKVVCGYVKANAASPVFELYESVNVYAIYNPETQIRTYYNADGKELLKDTKIVLNAESLKGAVAYYTEVITKTNEYGYEYTEYVTKYVAVAGNFFN